MIEVRRDAVVAGDPAVKIGVAVLKQGLVTVKLHPVVRHAAKCLQDDRLFDLPGKSRVHERHRRIRPHPAGVRALVIIERALVVL